MYSYGGFTYRRNQHNCKAIILQFKVNQNTKKKEKNIGFIHKNKTHSEFSLPFPEFIAAISSFIYFRQIQSYLFLNGKVR